MEEDIKNNKSLYQCQECGFHYKDKEMAEKCEAWCKKHKTCNVEITKQSEENKNDDCSSITSKHISNSLELEMCKGKCEEYLNNWKRSVADFINYKKEEMERMAKLMQYGKEDMILNILPIIDSIYLLKPHTNKLEFVSLSEGVLQIEKQIQEFLKKEGIEEIEINGNPPSPEALEGQRKFDPILMEVVEEVEIEGVESGIVVKELQKGYIINGKVLRPSKVRITK